MSATNEPTTTVPAANAPVTRKRVRRYNPIVETEFRVRQSKARMPSSCWGTYMHTAVMECIPGVEPRMISDRTVACVRVVSQWGPSFAGSTSRSRAGRDYAEALEKAAELRPSKVRFSKLRPSQQEVQVVNAVAKFLRSLGD